MKLLVALFVLIGFSSFSQLQVNEDPVIGEISQVNLGGALPESLFLARTENMQNGNISISFLIGNTRAYVSMELTPEEFEQLYELITAQLDKRENKKIEIKSSVSKDITKVSTDTLTLIFYKLNKKVRFDPNIPSFGDADLSPFFNRKQIDVLFGK